MKPKKPAGKKTVATLRHGDKRKNLPTAEFQEVMRKEEIEPRTVSYSRKVSGLEAEKENRNRDLDPQLVWRGKDQQDWTDLVVQAPPLYIQEKVHPKVLIEDLRRESKARAEREGSETPDLFADFNGLPRDARATEFYQHDANWSNRMILGDSLQVMASLAEREGLRGKVQCIYIDPPYGIKFNSNFQWSTTTRDVKEGNVDHITREPEVVRAFRDTWRDGIHTYLAYLRDRLNIARELLADSGSIFIQIGDENVHRVRAVLDEIFGEDNFASVVTFQSTTSLGTIGLSAAGDYLVWYYKDKSRAKYRPLYRGKGEKGALDYYSFVRAADGRMWRGSREELDSTDLEIFFPDNLTSQRPLGDGDLKEFRWKGLTFRPGKGTFKTDQRGLERLLKANRLYDTSGGVLSYVRLIRDYPVAAMNNLWTDTGTGSFTETKVYVVQTNTKIVERCILMTTDPGDLVLDPTCGSGTTAYVAEQWGRRWITIDTSRVALALARARIMGARYPFYLLADSREGQIKEAEVTHTAHSSQPVQGNIRQGFVYGRVPHITLKSIANNAEIDVIWDKWQQTLEPLREQLNSALGTNWQEWEFPRELSADSADSHRLNSSQKENLRKSALQRARSGGQAFQSVDELLKAWWEARISRQKEIDDSIAAKAEFEFLYDKPYEDKNKVRVAGPFTVESLSPHRVLAVDENDNVIDGWKISDGKGQFAAGTPDFATVILENLRTAGVQQAHKEDKINFTSLTGWPGEYICAEGRYLEGEGENAPVKRAGIFIGPEFGTVSRPDLVAAAREAADAGFDVLIACAFNYDAHSAEFEKLGRIPVLKARMNPDLHMAGELKNTGSGNLFVIFGEPDIEIKDAGDDQIRVKVKGVDVFKPQTGEVVSAGPEGIACWFIDTDYNEESFFVRQAYFLGANDPYKALKTTLRAEIDEAAWETLHSDTSRPFPKPATGRIAVKVINHLGDEVMKVFAVN